MAEWNLAADVGGTKISAALVDADGQIVHRKTVPTLASDGIAAVTERLVGLLHELAHMDGDLQPRACGVAAPGLIDAAAGEIRFAANLPGAQNYPLRQRLEEQLRMPVFIDNDLRLHALGESNYGAAKGCHDFLFVAVGTGVGGALFMDGHPYRGARHSAGEIGHIPIEAGPTALACACGRRGCLEVYASGPAIAAYFQRRAVENGLELAASKPSLKEIAQWLEQPGLAGELAREAVALGGSALGRGLGIAANLLDPELVVLGGGVAQTGEVWLNAMRHAMDEITLNRFEDSAIQLSQLGEDAALLGAAALARQMLAA
jgi:glucokinase